MPAKLEDRTDLGVALSLLRWIRGWTQEHLAVASGAKLDSIKAIEQGVRGTTPKTLGPVLASLGFSLEVLAEVLSFIRRLRGDSPRRRPAGKAARHAPGAPSLAATDLRRELLALLAPPAAAACEVDGPSGLEVSRRRAPELWARFRACSRQGQLDVAREAAEFHASGFVELLCEESRSAAGDSAARALHLATCAVAVAAAVPRSEGWRSRLEGYASAHLANALRVGGDLQRAHQEFSRAEELWQAGAGADPALLNGARVLHLEASLRRDQRHLPEAITLIERALELDRWRETPSLLLGKAKALEELGQHEAAIALLLRLGSQIDGARELRTLFGVRQSLLVNLCHLGRHAEAEQGLDEVRALATQLGNQLDLLRVDWLHGKIAAGRGRTDEAIAALGRVRAEFLAQGNAYDTALVTLELAEVHASLGHTAKVKALARESAPIFHAQGVHREAQRALRLFRRAAEQEQAGAELVRSVVTYLYRSRHDARVRYQRPA